MTKILWQNSERAERTSLSESVLAELPFQLLPFVTYPAATLEKTLSWQAECAATWGEETFLSIVVLIPAGASPEHLRSLVWSLRVQADLSLELCLVICGGKDDASLKENNKEFLAASLGGVWQDVLSKNKIDCKVYYSPSISDAFTALGSGEITLSGRFFCLLSANTVLHPSAVYSLRRLFRSGLVQASAVVVNELAVDSRLKSALKFYRKPVPSSWSILFANFWGEGLILARELLAELDWVSLASKRGDSLTAGTLSRWWICEQFGSNEFAWNIALQLVERQISVEQIPLALLVRVIEGHSVGDKQLNIAASSAELSSAKEQDSSGAIIQRAEQAAKILGLETDGFSLKCTGGIPHLSPNLRKALGLVRVIIPFHNNSEITKKCLSSFASQTCVNDLKFVLVDNRSETSEHLAVARHAESLFGDGRVNMVCCDSYFNFAALNNTGCMGADEPFFLFCNNDIEIVDDRLIARLRDWAGIKHVGIVGSKLLYPDGKVQSSGIVFAGVRPANVCDPGQFPHITREVSSVSLALAMIRKEVFDQLAGLDEIVCPNGFGDALIGKKLSSLGFKAIVEGEVQAIHYESRSRGFCSEEIELWELEASGIEIANSHDDFRANNQAMIVDLRVSAPLLRGRLSRLLKKKLLWLNSVISSIVYAGRE